MVDAISSENLEALPEPERLFELCRSVAVLEWIVCPSAQSEFPDRLDSGDKVIAPGGAFCDLFTVNSAASTALFRLDNGFADHLLIHFGPSGVVIWGFDHESPVNGWRQSSPTELPPGVRLDFLAGLPDELRHALEATGYPLDLMTFCLWRAKNDDAWRIGDVAFPVEEESGPAPDGSDWLLRAFNGPADYRDDVQDAYFDNADLDEWGHGATLSLPAVERIYAAEPLSGELVRELLEIANVEQALAGARAVGYPVRV